LLGTSNQENTETTQKLVVVSGINHNSCKNINNSKER